jgi:cell division protein FtsW
VKGQLESHVLVLVTLALVAFGLVMVYSATSAPAALADTDPMSYLKKQAGYALFGVVLMIVASRLDYRRLRLFAPALVLTALAGRARDRLPHQRGTPVDRDRPRNVPAV